MVNVIMSTRMRLMGVVILAKYDDGRLWVHGGNGNWHAINGVVDIEHFMKYSIEGADEQIQRMQLKSNVEYLVAAPLYRVRLNGEREYFLINPVDIIHTMLKTTKIKKEVAG
ncbi:MAG: hypothetical protein ACK5XQ_01575 [Flavobacteriales bacterium]|jgi:hypothetical protein